MKGRILVAAVLATLAGAAWLWLNSTSYHVSMARMNYRQLAFWGPLDDPFLQEIRLKLGPPTIRDRIFTVVALGTEYRYDKALNACDRHVTWLRQKGYLRPYSFRWTNSPEGHKALRLAAIRETTDFPYNWKTDSTNHLLTVYCRPESAAAWERLVGELQRSP